MNSVLWLGVDVLKAIKGHGPSDWEAYGVSIDTRTLKKGDIFFALPGPNYDGHQFISEAIKKGASVIISNAPSLAFGDKVIIVNDVLNSLINLGKFSRKRNKGKIIAITGSSGKTSVKEMLALSIGELGKVHYSEASYNNKIGVALSLSRMPADADFSIFELGMNKPGEISYLSNMVQPHIALINNVGSAHIGYFQSKKDIIKAKIEIIEGIASNGKLIINDDINLSIHLKKNLENRNIEVLRFGYKKNSDLILKKYQFSPKSSKIEALINQLNLSFTLNAPGEHMAMNSIAVLGISISLSVDTDKVIRSLSGFEAIKGRGMIYNLSIKGKFFKAIDESYNANPESTKASIKLLSEIDYLKSKRKILVLGDMMELGTFSKVIHIEMASFINNSEVDLVFCTGYEMKNLWENLNESKKGFYSNQSEILIKSLNDKIRENDLILFKGSSKSGVKIVLDTFKEEKLKRNIA